MNEVSSDSRSILFHDQLEPAQVGLEQQRLHAASDLALLAIKQKLIRYAEGLCRRNSDYKYLTGFTSARLIEIRWEFGTANKRIPLRLIGSECSEELTIFLVWHVKDLETSVEQQRHLQNQACELGIERMASIANLRAIL